MLETNVVQRDMTIRIIVWVIAIILGVVGLLLFGFSNLYATSSGADTPAILLGIPIGDILMFFSFSIIVLENIYNRNLKPYKAQFLAAKYITIGLLILILITVVLFLLCMKIGGHL